MSWGTWFAAILLNTIGCALISPDPLVSMGLTLVGLAFLLTQAPK